MSKDTIKIAELTDKWVKEGLKLLSNFNRNYEFKFYDFFYSLNLDLDNKYLKYLTSLDFLDENFRENTLYESTIENFSKLKSEIRDAIILKNFNSLFYLNLILLELFIDLSIAKRFNPKKENFLLFFIQKLFKKKKESIYQLQIKNKYVASKKLGIFSKLVNKKEKTGDFKLFFQIALIMYDIRNKFMFHINNYEFYYYHYLNINSKDELLLKQLKGIYKKCEDASITFSFDSYASNILKVFMKNLDLMIENLKKNKSTKKVIFIHSSFYGILNKNFGEFSLLVLYLLGKKDLDMFKYKSEK